MLANAQNTALAAARQALRRSAVQRASAAPGSASCYTTASASASSSVASSSARQALRKQPAAAPPPRATLPPLARTIHSGRPVYETDKPTHASVEEHIIPYPEDHERDPSDVGHSTTGGKVGPHTKRTLATFSMDQKVCVVTGAARGLGNLIARTFVESGSNAIAVLDLNASEAQAAAKDIEDWFLEHGQVSPGEIDVQGYGCDVSNEDNVMRVMAEIKERFGRIDVVVNSAGIVENFPATQYPTNKMKKLFDININGSYFVAREAAKHMLADGTKGSIVLIASMSAGVVNIPQPQGEPQQLSA